MSAFRAVLVSLALLLPAHATRAQVDPRACSGDVRTCLIGEALATARAITAVRDRSEALFAVAAAQADIGAVADALATARSIPDLRTRAEALVLVAAGQAKTGDAAGALATARSIRDPSEQSATL